MSLPVFSRWALAAVSLLAATQSSPAQGIANPLADVTDPVGSLWRAMNRRHLMEAAAIADMETERFRIAGQARIDAGRATTTFQRTAVHLAPAKFGALAPNPADRPAWTGQYDYALGYFEYVAKLDKCNLNDLADGWGLAFAMAFETYSGGQKVSAAQRKSYTEATRQNILHNPRFQAYTDEERQLLYEQEGMYAALAALRFGMAGQKGDKASQYQAQQEARGTLAGLWPYPVEGIELTSTGFEDRGFRLIREGKATVQFSPPPAPLVTDPQQLQLWREFVRVVQGRIPMTDLSGVMGECVIINWEIARGGQALDQQTGYWTFAGMKKIILTSPEWQRMNDIDKQRSLESFVIKTMTVRGDFIQAARPVTEQLTGPLLAGARANKIDQASLRLQRMNIVSNRAQENLDSIFPPKFAQYTLNDNGFALANAASRR